MRYSPQSYFFVFEVFESIFHKLGQQRHVTGQELAEYFLDYGTEKFGPLRDMVFKFWGIKSSEDLGEIVYNLINSNLLKKLATDTKGDFSGIFRIE